MAAAGGLKTDRALATAHIYISSITYNSLCTRRTTLDGPLPCVRSLVARPICWEGL